MFFNFGKIKLRTVTK